MSDPETGSRRAYGGLGKLDQRKWARSRDWVALCLWRSAGSTNGSARVVKTGSRVALGGLDSRDRPALPVKATPLGQARPTEVSALSRLDRVVRRAITAEPELWNEDIGEG